MKLTKVQVVFGVAIGILLLGAAVLFFIRILTVPKDTPIVIVGGSIYGQTYSSDTGGWTNNGGYFSASLHSDGDNPKKTDQLYLRGFQLNGSPLSPNPYPVLANGGWKIEYFNQTKKHVTERDALYFCSNAACSICNQAPGDWVYLLPGGHSRLEPRQNGSGITNEIHFHDKAKDCDDDQNTEDSDCDKIISIELTTCSGSVQDFDCSSGYCNVTVGNK